MLSRRFRPRAWSFDGRHSAAASIFHMLAARWRPLSVELRNKTAEPDPDDFRTNRHKRLPSGWSPWLLIK
jgi:hypothetical protein